MTDFPDYETAQKHLDKVLDAMFGADRRFSIDVTMTVEAALGEQPLFRYESYGKGLMYVQIYGLPPTIEERAKRKAAKIRLDRND